MQSHTLKRMKYSVENLHDNQQKRVITENQQKSAELLNALLDPFSHLVFFTFEIVLWRLQT